MSAFLIHRPLDESFSTFATPELERHGAGVCGGRKAFHTNLSTCDQCTSIRVGDSKHEFIKINLALNTTRMTFYLSL